MLGCLRRRGARKTPKRLRALHFRTVGPWLYLGLGRRKSIQAIVANPLRSYFHGALPTARTLDASRTGARDWQTQGDFKPREGNEVSRRARRRSRGCARTLYVSFAEVDKRLWLRDALSPIRSLSKERRGTRWTGAWPTDVINRSKSSPLSQAARSFRTKLFAAKLRVARGAVGDETPNPGRRGAQHHAS